MSGFYKSQRGVALLTILIMVVLATIMAAGILKYQDSSLQETKRILKQDQAFLYAQSAEYFLSELLKQDAKENQSDTLNETWAKPLPVFPIENGSVSGKLMDQNRFFNINSLTNDDGSVNPVAVSYFERLLIRLQLDPALAQAVIDWQDPDQQTGGVAGAENDYYQGLAQGYLAPNKMFNSVRELLLVRGFNIKIYDTLRPYITALPTHKSQMNLNTVSPLLLACLDEQLDINEVRQSIMTVRHHLQDITQYQQLWQLDPFKKISPQPQFAVLFSHQSNYFIADIQVQYDDYRRNMRSLLYRDGQKVYRYQQQWLANIDSDAVFSAAGE